MRFDALVQTSAKVAATRSRKAKIEHLAMLLRRLEGDEIEIAVAHLMGALRQGRVGLGPAALRDARAPAAPAPTLELRAVDDAFAELAAIRGAGSARKKVERLRALLERATDDEQDFLIRLVIGELRQGALEGILIDAVARAAELPPARVRRAAMLAGELTAVARAALDEGAEGLRRFGVELFRPLQPMLARPAEDLDDALERLGEASFELKLDGARVQLHKDGDEVKIFSRRGNEVTAAAPELVEAARVLPARSLILDGEAIALRPDGSPLPFQVTMRRFGRRLDVERTRRELPLSPFYFDLLYLDGDELLDEPQLRRAALLDELVPAAERTPRIQTADVDAARAFYDRALADGHEGVMAKALDAAYEAGSRGAGWLKIKTAHTLDLVVLAAEWGSGRRRGWLSNLHLGARDDERGGFVMLGKTFKGLTDKILVWQTEALLAREIGRDRHTVHVRPELVVEIAFSDVQASPRYPGGLALRFARVKRYREDKTPAQADDFATVRQIYARTTGEDPPPRA